MLESAFDLENKHEITNFQNVLQLLFISFILMKNAKNAYISHESPVHDKACWHVINTGSSFNLFTPFFFPPTDAHQVESTCFTELSV